MATPNFLIVPAESTIEQFGGTAILESTPSGGLNVVDFRLLGQSPVNTPLSSLAAEAALAGVAPDLVAGTEARKRRTIREWIAGTWLGKTVVAVSAAATFYGVTGVAEATAASASTTMVAEVIGTGSSGLWLHSGSPTGPLDLTMPDGDKFDVSCFEQGPNVGGYVDWLKGTDESSGHEGLASDAYLYTNTDTSNESAELAAQGVPECGSEQQSPEGIQGDTTGPEQTNVYNRQAAVDWALENAEDQAPASASCTWFVSNALWQGGLAKTPEWTSDGTLGGPLHGDYQAYVENVQPLPGTQTAWNAEDLLSYLRNTYPDSTWENIDFSSNNNDPADAQIGDLVFYNWGTGEGVSHVAIVTKIEPSGYLDVTDWSTYEDDGTRPSPVEMRGVTYSAVHNTWLQNRYPNVSAHLLHINTTGSPGNP